MRGYRWEVQLARRKSKRGKAIGEMGIRYGIGIERVMVEEKMEGLMAVKIKLGKEGWRLIGVYMYKWGY